MGPDICERRKIWRWEIIAGLCLLNGWRKGAELGVSHGRFTAFVCGVLQDASMIAVDLWQEIPARDVPGSETYADRPHEAVYRNFVAHCDKYLKGRVMIYREDTAEAARHVDDGALDYVFIDADHTYEGCKRDIAAWAPKVRKGGLIAGHDYNERWPGVVQAVNERFERVTLMPDSVWAVRK